MPIRSSTVHGFDAAAAVYRPDARWHNLYWLTNSGGSSARSYWESARNSPGGIFHVGRIELPMAATILPRDYYRTPKAWAETMWPNLFYWSEVDRGGYFAAWEQPVLFTDEMRNAFRSIRMSQREE